MVDVQYAFPDADTCLRAIRPGSTSTSSSSRRRCLPTTSTAMRDSTAEQPIPIAAGEWLATRYEFADLMDRGKISVAQPDVGRVGGFTEAKRVCTMAEQRGLLIVPHLWKTGISIAAAAHLAATTPNCAFIEFLPDELCESSLRRELVSNELQMVNGEIPIPRRPGLGIDLNRDALEAFRREAAAVTATLSLT